MDHDRSCADYRRSRSRVKLVVARALREDRFRIGPEILHRALHDQLGIILDCLLIGIGRDFRLLRPLRALEEVGGHQSHEIGDRRGAEAEVATVGRIGRECAAGQKLKRDAGGTRGHDFNVAARFDLTPQRIVELIEESELGANLFLLQSECLRNCALRHDETSLRDSRHMRHHSTGRRGG